MSAEERQAWGKVMERLTGLRRAIIEIQLEKINHQAEQMMKQLQEEAQHEG
jgi:ribosomal protein L18E